MSHVFVSYKREDELRVGRLARALEAEGLDIWWDRGLPGGESWHANIEAKLRDAGCVVVAWSTLSAGEDGGYVREEARRGLARNILVPVLLDPLQHLPLGFGEIQALDLTRWRGERRDPHFQDLVATIRAKLAGEPLPAPRGPVKRIARRLMWGSVPTLALIAAALFVFDAFGVATQVCAMPALQPGLSDSCGSVGLGGRPDRAERLAWQTRTPGSCAALREHIARFPEGVYRSQAADLLTGRKVTVVETWRPATRTLTLFQPAPDSAANDEVAAKARALEQAQSSADKLCRGFGAGSLFRPVSAAAVADHWSCTRSGAGFVCSFDGHAECQLQEHQEQTQDSCG